MNKRPKLSLGMLAAVVALAACGKVTVANMNWQSAEVLAHIDKLTLRSGYGCDVELVPGDTMPTLTAMMEKGKCDVALKNRAPGNRSYASPRTTTSATSSRT